MNARFATIGLLGLSVCLSACGKAGELQRPPPLFGKPAANSADATAQHQNDAARNRAAAAAEPAPENLSDQPNSPPLATAPYHPPVPGREDPFGPNGPPTALPEPGQPAAEQ